MRIEHRECGVYSQTRARKTCISCVSVWFRLVPFLYIAFRPFHLVVFVFCSNTWLVLLIVRLAVCARCASYCILSCVCFFFVLSLSHFFHFVAFLIFFFRVCFCFCMEQIVCRYISLDVTTLAYLTRIAMQWVICVFCRIGALIIQHRISGCGSAARYLLPFLALSHSLPLSFSAHIMLSSSFLPYFTNCELRCSLFCIVFYLSSVSDYSHAC